MHRNTEQRWSRVTDKWEMLHINHVIAQSDWSIHPFITFRSMMSFCLYTKVHLKKQTIIVIIFLNSSNWSRCKAVSNCCYVPDACYLHMVMYKWKQRLRFWQSEWISCWVQALQQWTLELRDSSIRICKIIKDLFLNMYS